jgi:hypothetical protein
MIITHQLFQSFYRFFMKKVLHLPTLIVIKAIEIKEKFYLNNAEATN